MLKRCNACSFTFTADPPDEKEITKFYLSEDYISHTDKKQSLTDHLYHLARNFMLRKKYSLVRKMMRQGNRYSGRYRERYRLFRLSYEREGMERHGD